MFFLIMYGLCKMDEENVFIYCSPPGCVFPFIQKFL